jgi:hypothetical protein
VRKNGVRHPENSEVSEKNSKVNEKNQATSQVSRGKASVQIDVNFQDALGSL